MPLPLGIMELPMKCVQCVNGECREVRITSCRCNLSFICSFFSFVHVSEHIYFSLFKIIALPFSVNISQENLTNINNTITEAIKQQQEKE